MFELRWYQEEGIEALMNYSYQHNPLLAFPTGCHAKGHLILMADGSVKPVEDIKVGDKLMGANSQPRTVLALARGRQEMRRVIPNKGRPFVVNLDHKLPVWVTQSHNHRNYDCEKSKEEIITVRQYENGSNWYRHSRKLKIGTCDFPTKSLDIPPYILGVLLGDGCFRNGRVSLTTMDQECDFAVSEYAETLGLTVKRSAKDNNSLAWEVNFVGTKKVDNILYHKIKMLNLAEKLSIEKFIPFDYKTGDRNQRLELLAGLIDTDGYLDRRSNVFEYTTSSKQLCEDVRFICKSLGLRVNHRVKTAKCNVAYILQISGNVEMLPLRVPRRKPRPSKLNKRTDVTGFKVEKLPIDDYYGFTLDGDHLYLDSEFVIHHNTGKSVIIAEFIKRALMQFPTTRVMMLTHVGELVAQNAEKLKGVWQQAPLGIYSASLNERDVGRPITFGNMQSVYNYIKKQTENNQPHFGKIDLLIVDEAHLISEKDETTYRKIISALYAENPYIKVIGLTATPYRMKTGMLTENGIFGEVIYDLTQPDMFVRLIKEGYLAPLIPKRTSIEIDVSNVSLVANEYNLKQLQTVSDTDEITFNAVREIVECGLSQNRTSWIIFCTSVQHCEHVNAMLLSLGISSAVCHSKLSKKENDDVIYAFKQGKLTCLVNNNKLTTGFDNPKIDLIGMLRPTNSVGLWVQMLGRGTRPYPTKRDCLVLDFAGNTKRLGCINDPNIPNKKRKKGGGGTGDAPVKVCKECNCYNHAKARFCEVCGTEFTFESNLFNTASTLELIKDTSPQFELIPVDQVIYNEHKSANGGVPTLEVTYLCGLSKFKEYVCFEHTGYARKRAEMWWGQRSAEQCPDRVYEVLGRADSLKKPSMITVHINKKYPEIKSVTF